MNNRSRYSFLSARGQHGLTLIEILVALVISLVLMAGVIQLFIGSKQTYRFHDALSRLQENGRLALDTMATDIRMASYSPPGVPAPANAVATTGADITVRWLDNGNLETRMYAVGPRTAGPTGPAFCPAAGTSLRLNRNGGGLQEFIEGVEAMQILYGVCNIDTDGDGVPDSVGPPGYVPAATVTAAGDWPNVCSVRIHLLLVSLENNIVSEPQTVFFPIDSVNTIAPADRCLRQAFSTTVRIRNRWPLR